MQNRLFLLAAALLLALAGCGSMGSDVSRTASGWLPNVDGGPAGGPGGGEAPMRVQQPKDSASQGRPARVALLVPTTGKHAALGKSFVDAAQMAVGDVAAGNFDLTPKDSGDTPESAAAAARAAIAEGAEMIIGPVFSGSVSAVKEVAGAVNIPVLGLSNDWNVAGNGTYILGFNPQQQVERVANFAFSRGQSRIAVLASEGIYGDLAVDALRRSGASMAAIERFAPGKGAEAAAQLGMRRAEFDALLLPEGGTGLTRLSTALTQAGLTAREVPILGTGLWDDPSVAMSKPVQGGWFAAPEPGPRQRFNARFFATYNYRPVRLATLAYDAVALAAVLARQGQPYDASALTNPNGFAGVDGIFRLTPDGLAERGLAVLEVRAGGALVVDPAPKRF